MKQFQALCPERLAELQVTAASAVVWHAGELFLLSDDQAVLQCYALQGDFLAEHVLLDETWPHEAKARKAAKADFEMLCQLPGGWLFALGSGSTEQRRRGVLWRAGQSSGVIDLTPLFITLEEHFPELNLEGAVVMDDRLLLAQRGNGQSGRNALIGLDLAQVMEQLMLGRLGSECLRAITSVELGLLAGVPLGFTDLCLDLQGRLLFSAAAEDSASTYADGRCTGSVIGWLAGQQVQALWPLSGEAKIEGICVVDDGSLRLVNDPDSAASRSCLFRVRLPDF